MKFIGFARVPAISRESITTARLLYSIDSGRGKRMSNLSSVAADTLASYYQEVRDKIHELVAPLSNEQLWRKPYSYGNSVGHLLLHLTGNLNHYIGARIAETGYVRDRDREFTEASKPAKQQVIANFDRAVAMVAQTIRRQSPEDWTAAYSADTPSKNRFAVLMRMAAHAEHHIGQMQYLVRELAKEDSSRAWGGR
jgi:uncharacterized damage-inducible protein DinB